MTGKIITKCNYDYLIYVFISFCKSKMCHQCLPTKDHRMKSKYWRPCFDTLFVTMKPQNQTHYINVYCLLFGLVQVQNSSLKGKDLDQNRTLKSLFTTHPPSSQYIIVVFASIVMKPPHPITTQISNTNLIPGFKLKNNWYWVDILNIRIG